MTAYAIYIITNKVNGKQYVGITKRLNRRWTEHKMMNGDCIALYSAFKKYGVDNFVFTHIADAFDKDAACTIERLLIEEKNTIAPHGYNMTTGGDGGFVMSEESRAKMSAAKKGKPAHNKGKPSNPESVAKMSATKKGKPSNRKGAVHSEETKAKMVLAQKARYAAQRAIKQASGAPA
jgi:group I intron endonuclease